MGNALQAIVSKTQHFLVTGALRREPLPCLGDPPEPPDPYLQEYNSVHLYMRTESGTGRGGAGETAARTHRRMTSRRLLADYHINPNPGKIAQTRQYLLQVLFFIFIQIQVEKKSTKVRRWAKLPKISNLRPYFFGLFKSAVLYVQYRSTATDKCAEIVRRLTH